MNAADPESQKQQLTAFLKGLEEVGYVDGKNVVIEYRWAEGKIERLPAIAADLVQRQVSVIAATTTPAALAAQAATTTIPIVFESGSDPVRLGLVASLNRPGANVTGATSLIVELQPKRLELLHELLPNVSVMAFLVNPADRALAQSQTREVLSAARSRGLELHILNASSERGFDAVFADVKRLRVGGLVIGAGSIFVRETSELAALTIRHAVPAIYENRNFAAAGGLMSYGADIVNNYRLVGVYTGRVLKGENPTELPVLQPAKFDLVINVKTAKMLGLTVPQALLAAATEVIE
jgi:putative tryptophan/tyrosine transport system substrate-binding protein